MTAYRGEDMIGDNGYGTEESIYKHTPSPGDTTMKTEEQREHNQYLACLVNDIAFKASLLRIAEKALEDIRGLCVSSTYWNNPDYPNCARLLKQHHKIVSDAKVKAEEMRAIEYGDDVEVPKRKRNIGGAAMTTYRGEDMIGDNGYGTTEHALKSAHDALWAIANMQITENTDKGEVLALCMSIARLELEKCSTAGK